MKRNLLGISLITISCLYGMLAAVIILITLLTGTPVIYGVGISIIVLIIQFLISPFFTDISMKWFYRARFDYEIPDYLKKFIEEVCQRHNMKYPKVGFIDDGAPNAFTYGHTKNDARVIITRGILELLNEEEVKAVVGHELGHASHYDMLFMTVAQLVPLILYGIYEMFIDSNTKDRNDKDSGYGLIIAIVAYILYIISNYIVLWLSRTREYYADSFSIEETKNPHALANALVKVGYGLSTAETNAKHSAAKSNALGIFDSKTSKALVVSSTEENGHLSRENIKQAMKWEQWNVWAKWYELNSTHPLISKRLLAISARSKEYNQEPYIVFDLKKEESYVDDFLKEVIIDFLPKLSLLICIGVAVYCLATKEPFSLYFGLYIIVTVAFSFVKFKRRYPTYSFDNSTVKDLLGEVKVSHITAIPCSLEGTIIGRGNPGCIFNEDFVIKDKTGIIFLDYNQPVRIVNKIFALFKSPDYFDKKIKIKGWYRRSPVPYVEIKSMEIDGKEKKIYTYAANIAILLIGLAIGIYFIIAGL